MKKRFISLCLTLALTAATAGAAFSDISSGSLQQTASVLGSLGIMQGTGNNRFEPNRPLTRAEFCKLAVTAMGIDDASPYASYTIFPDVRASHWAARYVNAALRHPDFKDNYIIRGYADGTFGPDRQLTYGEVCTMLLRMLGYKESDIGPFWPADYIAQANALGLTRGISIKDAKTPVTRADAATMLLNTLGTATRSDGQGGSPLISRVSSSTVENCILLETSETDSSLALLAVLPGTSISHANTFVYGIATSANIPSEYKIVKNGAVIDPSGLKKYDVVTLDAANRQALVSDTRVSGRYSEGGPTVSYPQEVKVYGNSFRISDSAAAFFKDMKLKDYITLLFDADGNVAAAYPRSTVSADMQGIVTAIDESKATVTLTNGVTLRNMDIDKLDKPTALMGRLVSVSTNGDNAVLTRRTLSGKTSGEWSLSDGKLGSKPVSSRVNVYEEVLSGAPLSRIALSDISLSKVPSSDIRYTVTDSAGTITTVILGDVTGDSWLYGMGYGEKIKDNSYFDEPNDDDVVNNKKWGLYSDEEKKKYRDEHTSYSYIESVVLRHWSDGKEIKDKFKVLSLPSGLSGGPIAVPKGYSTDENIVNTSLDIKKLKLIDTVDRTAFDGASGVRTKDGYYALADQLGIYDTENRDFIATLQSAKSNYTKFALYANDTAEDGGKIRIITVSNK